MSCSCCIPPADNTPHAMPPRSHSPYPPQKKIKKFRRKAAPPRGCPHGGGTPSRHDAHVSRTSKAHTHATRQQYAQRGAMINTPHAARRPPACTCTRHTRPICVQDVHLHGNSPPPANTPASQCPARHSHGTTWQRQPTRCSAGQKTAHPKRRRATRAFSLFRVLYKYYLYTYAKRKKIKSFPRHIHGVKHLFAARQNRAFPGVLFGKLWDSPWVRFEAHRSHGKGIYTHVGWRMYSGQVSSI